MAVTQVPPSGWMPSLTGDVQAPAGASSVGGVRLTVAWSADPVVLDATVHLGGVAFTSMGEAQASGNDRVWSFYGPSQAAPAAVAAGLSQVSNEMTPGTTLTVTAEGVQQFSPEGGLVPAGDPVELGVLEVVTWEEWRRLNGGD